MKSKYIIILTLGVALILILLIIQPFKNKSDVVEEFVLVEDTYIPKYSSIELAERLEKAYSSNSLEEVEYFFEEWHSDIPPNSPDFENQHPMIKDVYDIYRALFITENAEYIKNQQAKYLAIQNRISYYLDESIALNDGTSVISFTENEIPYFRPSIRVKGKKILYLTNEYKEALFLFLNNSGTESETLTHPNESKKMKRFYFINQYIPVELLEGRTWIVESPPSTDGFYFENNHSDTLNINYQIYYYGYSATIKRTANGWILKNRKTTSVI